MEAVINENNIELVVKLNLVASNIDAQLNTAKDALSKNPDINSIVLNLENVTEIDSMGINLVVGLYKQVHSENRKFSVINTSRAILNLFNLFKLTSYFEVS
ncbi:MAG: STAS domain-containing protein [Candidatus Cloacimonadales bacterium]|jgi:anti-anti-sigma factor|nr:STAS domain-containing protein [Candidatus Cloacimonadota bacterium]MDD2650271.1 STAS domain-containing protein [Candidatus Cloacimonadota bacterium]MDD3501838.1 STAS domain-containing protein [Candidatus Cloacimonadota bacterium]MDX9977544.1 STAS domain-containing protein [Candidatus Cloacimonadales bacterium]